jgi:hypothetical protein
MKLLILIAVVAGLGFNSPDKADIKQLSKVKQEKAVVDREINKLKEEILSLKVPVIIEPTFEVNLDIDGLKLAENQSDEEINNREETQICMAD